MPAQTSHSCSWRRNLYAIWLIEFIALAGFNVVLPILPLYIRQLGVQDERSVRVWAGVIFSAHAVTMAISSPIWGALSDRHGRKVMVARAILSGAVLIPLMGWVTSVQQLALLRALQGALTGTVTAATTLVASDVPRERAGYALGTLQTLVFAGAAVGPLLGGMIAATWGYRVAFHVAGGLLLSAGVTVILFVREPTPVPRPPQRASMGGRRWSLQESVQAHFGPIWRSAPIVTILGMRLFTRSAEQVLRPTLPLFVEDIVGVGGRVAYITGVVNGINAAATGLGALSLGRFCDRWGHKRILLASVLVAMACYAPQALVKHATWLVVLQAGAGLAMGGIVAALSSGLAKVSEDGREGAVYGADATVGAVAETFGPMLGSALAVGLGLGIPFVLVAGILAASALFLVAPSLRDRLQTDE